MNESYKKTFLICLVILIILTSLLHFPADDGLRHIGLSFGNSKSWGDVYPFSVFEKFRDYNPWFGYDMTLRLIANALKCLPISLLTLKFLLAKAIIILFLSVFFYLVLNRSGILDDIKDRDTFTLALIILIALIVYPYTRIMTARPFALGIFYLIYSIGRKGLIRGVISSLALTFFYPYLSWFYIIPVAFLHFIKGDKKFAFGSAAFIILFLSFQPSSFWGFQAALAKSDLVRSAIRIPIGEFNSTFKSFVFYFYLAGFLILFPWLSKDARRLNYTNLMILIYLLPALKYIRYFIDFILPLLFVSFGREISHIIGEPYRKLISSWTLLIQNSLCKIKSTLKRKPAKPAGLKNKGNTGRSISLKPYIAVSYLLVFALFINLNIRQIKSLKDLNGMLSHIPEGSLVLVWFNLQYQILFLRPDLRLIPSCEMGFPKAEISNEYLDFFNEGMFASLAHKTGAKYFLESRVQYLDPQEGEYIKLIDKNKDVKLWEMLFRDKNKPSNSEP